MSTISVNRSYNRIVMPNMVEQFLFWHLPTSIEFSEWYLKQDSSIRELKKLPKTCELKSSPGWADPLMTQSGQVKVVRWLRYASLVASAPVWAALAFLILAFLEPVNLALLLVSLVFATVAPVICTVLFARSKGVSFDIPHRSLRIEPFLLAIVSYSLGTILLLMGQAPALVTGLMSAYAINTTVMLIVTLYWKISVHAAGVVGPLSFLVYRLGLWSTFLYASVIPVAMLKLRLKEHSVAQSMAASTLTIAITWLQILFLVPIIP